LLLVFKKSGRAAKVTYLIPNEVRPKMPALIRLCFFMAKYKAKSIKDTPSKSLWLFTKPSTITKGEVAKNKAVF